MPKKILYEERKKLGLCVDCSAKSIVGRIYCKKCRIRHLDQNKKKKNQLLCAGPAVQVENSPTKQDATTALEKCRT